MTSSGSAQHIADPGEPGCPPRLRAVRSAARRCCRDAGVRPGTSSALDGIDEFPLLREVSRSSRATVACKSPTCSRSSAIAASRAAQVSHPGAGGGRSVTTDHDQSRPAVIKPTRWADFEKIAKPTASHAQSPGNLLSERWVMRMLTSPTVSTENSSCTAYRSGRQFRKQGPLGRRRG
jgi:hypothetical protein